MAAPTFDFTPANYAVKKGNGLGPRTRIISLSKTNMTQAELDEVARLMQAGGTAGTDDAVTIAAVVSDQTVSGEAGVFVGGTSDIVYLAVQGTGTLTAGADYRGVTGVTMAVVVDFDQSPA
jgi:hypothetical protein